MFGFTASPCPTCLGPQESSIYRSYFCGLSCRLAADYSPAARLLVNRDATLLSVLGAGVGEAEPAGDSGTCCNPLGRARELRRSEEHAHFAAAVTVCGLGAKLRDDSEDEGGLRQRGARFLGRAWKPAEDRAASVLHGMGFPVAEVRERLGSQARVESKGPGLLAAAAPTSESYEVIFRHAALIGGAGEKAEPFARFGRMLGRLIYWRDALDDREKDLRSGRFNPLQLARPEELAERASATAEEWVSSVSDLGLKRFGSLAEHIVGTTITRHRDLAPLAFASTRRSKERKRKKESPWWHCCDCCHCGGCPSAGGRTAGASGGFCDSLCDWGPGDVGCIDCCPCDGC